MYQFVKCNINVANAALNIEASTDKMFRKLTGIGIMPSDHAAMLAGNLKMGMAVNGNEIFTEDNIADFFYCDSSVPLNDKLYHGSKQNPLMEEASGSTVKMKFFHTGVLALPYDVYLILRVENIDEQLDKQDK